MFRENDGYYSEWFISKHVIIMYHKIIIMILTSINTQKWVDYVILHAVFFMTLHQSCYRDPSSELLQRSLRTYVPRSNSRWVKQKKIKLPSEHRCSFLLLVICNSTSHAYPFSYVGHENLASDGFPSMVTYTFPWLSRLLNYFVLLRFFWGGSHRRDGNDEIVEACKGANIM